LFLGASGTTLGVGSSDVGCWRHVYTEELDMQRNLDIRIGKTFQHLHSVAKESSPRHSVRGTVYAKQVI